MSMDSALEQVCEVLNVPRATAERALRAARTGEEQHRIYEPSQIQAWVTDAVQLYLEAPEKYAFAAPKTGEMGDILAQTLAKINSPQQQNAVTTVQQQSTTDSQSSYPNSSQNVNQGMQNPPVLALPAPQNMSQEDKDVQDAINLSKITATRNSGHNDNSAEVVDLTTGQSAADVELAKAIEASIATANQTGDVAVMGAMLGDPHFRERKSVADAPGLRNIGNTCYLNSLLQTFFHIPDFREAILRFNGVEQTQGASATTPAGDNNNGAINHDRIFVAELQRLFSGLLLTNQSFVDPARLLGKFTDPMTGKPFQIGDQQDAADFSEKLLASVNRGMLSLNPDGVGPGSSVCAHSGVGSADEPMHQLVRELFFADATEARVVAAAESGLSGSGLAGSSSILPAEDLSNHSFEDGTVAPSHEHGSAGVKALATSPAPAPGSPLRGTERSTFTKVRLGALVLPVPKQSDLDRFVQAPNARLDEGESADGFHSTVHEAVSLLDCLEDSLESHIDDFTTDSGRRTTAHAITTFDSAPGVLSFTLSRVHYETDKQQFVKRETRVVMPEEFYLDRFMSKNRDHVRDSRQLVSLWKQQLVERKRDLDRFEHFAGNAFGLDEALRATLQYLSDRQAGKAADVPATVKDFVQGALAVEEDRIRSLREQVADLSGTIATAYDGVGKEFKYHLFALWIHQGVAGTGHYYCYIKHPHTQQWTKFNDQRVTVVSRDEVFADAIGGARQNTSAYVAMYLSDSQVRKWDEILWKSVLVSSPSTDNDEMRDVNDFQRDSARREALMAAEAKFFGALIPVPVRAEIEKENVSFRAELADHEKKHADKTEVLAREFAEAMDAARERASTYVTASQDLSADINVFVPLGDPYVKVGGAFVGNAVASNIDYTAFLVLLGDVYLPVLEAELLIHLYKKCIGQPIEKDIAYPNYEKCKQRLGDVAMMRATDLALNVSDAPADSGSSGRVVDTKSLVSLARTARRCFGVNIDVMKYMSSSSAGLVGELAAEFMGNAVKCCFNALRYEMSIMRDLDLAPDAPVLRLRPLLALTYLSLDQLITFICSKLNDSNKATLRSAVTFVAYLATVPELRPLLKIDSNFNAPTLIMDISGRLSKFAHECSGPAAQFATDLAHALTEVLDACMTQAVDAQRMAAEYFGSLQTFYGINSVPISLEQSGYKWSQLFEQMSNAFRTSLANGWSHLRPAETTVSFSKLPSVVETTASTDHLSKDDTTVDTGVQNEDEMDVN